MHIVFFFAAEFVEAARKADRDAPVWREGQYLATPKSASVGTNGDSTVHARDPVEEVPGVVAGKVPRTRLLKT